MNMKYSNDCYGGLSWQKKKTNEQENLLRNRVPRDKNTHLTIDKFAHENG